MCRIVSWVVGKGFGMTIVFSWENCQPLPCFIFYSKSKLACYSGYLLIWYFCIPILCDEKDISFFLVLVLEGVVGLHRTGQLQVRHQLLGHRIELLWCWMVCLGNELRSFLSFLRLYPSTAFQILFWLWGLFDSISCKEFLPTVVDTMVIWI